MADEDDDFADDETTETTDESKESEDTSDAVDSEEEASTDEEEEETFEIDIVVEDGTCVESANSYVSYEDALKYMQSHNRTEWLEATENEQKGSLVKATQYVDRVFRWKGRRKFEDQRLAFPRVMLRDLDGYEVKGIPWRLKEAIIEAAYYGYQDELFTVTGSETGEVKKKRVEGAVEIEYYESTDSDEDDEGSSKYKVLNYLLRGLYIPKRWKGGINTPLMWTGL